MLLMLLARHLWKPNFKPELACVSKKSGVSSPEVSDIPRIGAPNTKVDVFHLAQGGFVNSKSQMHPLRLCGAKNR
jgi:hypothetical protein